MTLAREVSRDIDWSPVVAVKPTAYVLNDGLEQQPLAEVHGMVAEQVRSTSPQATAAASNGSNASRTITSNVQWPLVAVCTR